MQRVLTSPHTLDGALGELVHAQFHLLVVARVVQYFEKALHRLHWLLLLLLELHLLYAVLQLLFELLLPLVLTALKFSRKECLGLLIAVCFDLGPHLSKVEAILSLEICLVLLHLDLLC